MKRTLILVLISAVMCLLPSGCSAQAKVFESVAKLPDVTSVYIGKAAMRMAGGAAMVSSELSGASADAIKKINSHETITCENKKTNPAADDKAAEVISRLKLEVLVESSEGDEKAIIYGGVPAEDDPDYVKNILIYNVTPSEFNLVYIAGLINLAEFVKDGGK